MRLVGGILFAALSSCGCASRSDSPEVRAKPSYFDRNGDGKVDIESHRHRGIADADWQFRDDDYDGRFEKKILYGVAVKETAVDIEVPTGVKIRQMR